jgi:hypothetical protein
LYSHTFMPVRSASRSACSTIANQSSLKNAGFSAVVASGKITVSRMPSLRMSASWRSTSSSVIVPFQNQSIVGLLSPGGFSKRAADSGAAPGASRRCRTPATESSLRAAACMGDTAARTSAVATPRAIVACLTEGVGSSRWCGRDMPTPQC